MTAAENSAHENSTQKDFFPPTSLEKSVRELGADAIRYRADYIMLPMRDGVRLATVVIRPRAEGRYPTLGIRSPYAETSIHEPFKPLAKAQFEHDYVLLVQNERGTEWSEGEFGFLTKTTSDAQDTLDWVAAQDWSNGKVGPARLLVDGREPAEARRHRAPGPDRLRADELGRGHRQRPGRRTDRKAASTTAASR